METASERMVPNEMAGTAGALIEGFEDPAMEDVGEEYLAEAVVRLIRHNRAVQKALLDFAMSCPNIKTEL